MSAIFGVSAAPVAAETITLLITYPTSSPQGKLLDQYGAEYEKLHPGTDIEFIHTGGAETLEKFAILSAAGEAPDVLHVAPITLDDFSAFSPLPADVVDRMKDAYIPAAMQLSTYQGKVYGLTTEFQTAAVVYSKDLLAAAGIDSAPTPSSWDAYLALAQKLTQRNSDGTTKIYGAEASDWRVTNDVRAYINGDGYDVISPDGEPQLNSRPMEQAVSKWSQLVRNGVIAFGQHPEMLSRGRAVMTTWEPWISNTLKSETPDLFNSDGYGVSPAPFGKLGKPYVYTYGWSWLVTRQSKHAEAALKFLTWLNLDVTDNGTTRMGTVLTELGSLPDTYADLQHQPGFNNGFVRGYIDAVAGYVQSPVPSIPGAQHWEDALRPQLQAILKGQKSVIQGLEQAQVDYRTALEKAAQAE